jgi:hypothetical protein
MARFQTDPARLNYTVAQNGKEYNLRLLQRAQTIFTTLLSFLPSNYISTVSGPSYTVELKCVAVELARLELALEDVATDLDYRTTRPEFLYAMVGYFCFLNGKLPDLGFDDVEFRSFFLNLLKIYFQGSIPTSIKDAVELFIADGVVVTENYILIRKGATGYDISDEFGFQVDINQGNNQFPPDVFRIEAALSQIIDVIRPAHTLYRIRYIFTDKYNPNDPIGQVLDSMRWILKDYRYEDFRSYWTGVRNRDRLGKKVNRAVVAEDHSQDF